MFVPALFLTFGKVNPGSPQIDIFLGGEVTIFFFGERGQIDGKFYGRWQILLARNHQLIVRAGTEASPSLTQRVSDGSEDDGWSSSPNLIRPHSWRDGGEGPHANDEHLARVFR